MDTKFLVRKSTGDQPIAAEAELREYLQKGQCRPADFLFDFEAHKWGRVGDHPALASLFAEKPAQAPDRRVIYFLAPGAPVTAPLGPFSTKEIQNRAQLREICASTWVFVEGDKEWRQVRNVKILNDMMPALPIDAPSPPVAAQPAPGATSAPDAGMPEFSIGLETAGGPPPLNAPGKPDTGAPPPFSLELGASLSFEPSAAPAKPEREVPSNPSITLDLGSGGPAGASATDAASPHAADDDAHIEREEITMAFDTKGLNLHSEHASLPPAPPKAKAPGAPPAPPGSAPRGAPPLPPSPVAVGAPAPELELNMATNPAIPRPKPKAKDNDGFDGIVAEIPMDPIWLVKQANNEAVSGPFRFLEVIKYLEEGKLNRNDKIARSGTKAFVKIQQQYEFNVKYSIETVVENGQEKQKILIRRRHPRVPYMTGVQIVSKHGLLAGQCVNISAGGILMEIAKAEFNLGDIIEIKILPGLIAKAITCKSLIIGKIPKIPPGYALKFEDLKQDDKEAIEYYVQETLKREMSKKN